VNIATSRSPFRKNCTREKVQDSTLGLFVFITFLKFIFLFFEHMASLPLSPVLLIRIDEDAMQIGH
jgi:hypothetical protein